MRVYVAVLFVLLLALTVGFVTTDKLDSAAKDLATGLDGLEEAITTGKWTAAGHGVDELSGKWDRYKGWWAIVIDHREIDNIELSLTRIEQYVRMQDRALAAGELAVLKQMLENIIEKEKVNLKNIF